jgi:hypothetical protein
MANNCCATTSSSLDVDNNAQVNIIVAKMHAVRSCHYTLTAVVTKKITIGNCQSMLNRIQHALMIANSAIDHPALLEINRKVAVMGGRQFSSCQKTGLSLFIVCLFIWVI